MENNKITTNWNDEEESKRINEFMELHDISKVEESREGFEKMMDSIIGNGEIKYNQVDFPVLNSREDKKKYLSKRLHSKKVYDFITELISKDVAYLDRLELAKRDADNEAEIMIVELEVGGINEDN